MSAGLDHFLRDLAEVIDTEAPTVTMREVMQRRVTSSAEADDVTSDLTDGLDPHHVRPRWCVPALVLVAASFVAGLVIVAARGAEPPEQRPIEPPPTNTALQTTVTAPESVFSTSTVRLHDELVVSPCPSVQCGPTTTGVIAHRCAVCTNLIDIDFRGAAEVERTLVGAGSLPDGLQFTSGGTVTSTRSPQLEEWSADFQQRLTLGWSDGTCSEHAAISVAPPLAADIDDAIAERRAELDSGATTESGLLFWCADGIAARVDYRGTGLDTAADFARSVGFSTADHVVAAAMPGFSYGIEPPQSTNSALLYQGDGKELRVLSFSGTETSFDMLRTRAEGEPFVIAGRRVLWQLDEQLAIEWDDHTIVYVDGTGLTNEQLLAIAADLGPVDPALAPPVTEDCDRFGALCG